MSRLLAVGASFTNWEIIFFHKSKLSPESHARFGGLFLKTGSYIFTVEVKKCINSGKIFW